MPLLSWVDDEDDKLKYADCEFRRFGCATEAQARAREVVLDFAERCYRGERNVARVLWGATGSGKTHLLAATSYALSTINIATCSFHPESVLYLDWIRSLYSKREKHLVDDVDNHVATFIRDHSVVILDDLGAEYTKADQWAENEYRKLIELCYGQRALLIGTNLNPLQIQKLIGARAYSRLAEMTGGLSGWVDLSKVSDRRLQ